MDIFKENWHNFSKFPKNVINDLYKLCFQNYCAWLIKVVMKRNNLNCINPSWCERGGGQNQPSEQPSFQHLAVSVKIKFVGQILVKSTTNSTNTLRKCT